MSAGYFITFEGGEGSGKTTQINKLSEFLTGRGKKVITTREPGGTAEAEKIRNLLVQRDGGNWSHMAECLLFYAARHMHVEQIIQPALDNGKIVISDRFADTTLAYQGYGYGLDHDKIEAIHKTVIGDLQPDLTFILDIDPEEGLHRSGRRLAAESLELDQTEDKYENLELEFHKRLREGYLHIAKAAPKRCEVINAHEGLGEISKKIQAIAMDRIEG